MRKKTSRIIMRIEVSPSVPDAIETAMKQFGATHNSIFSRAILWFCEQDEEVQAEILGLLPEKSGIDPVQRMLKAMARKAQPRGHE